tara:strand:+ start:321 stop:632 length:312 start_codon:yes stop_codon:yes gene_type:complete
MFDHGHISLSSQLDKLEQISNTISKLLEKNDAGQISDLDKIRKKIIKDIEIKNYKFNEDNKKTVVSLISKNEIIISKILEKSQKDLKILSDEKKRSQAYLKNF